MRANNFIICIKVAPQTTRGLYDYFSLESHLLCDSFIVVVVVFIGIYVMSATHDVTSNVKIQTSEI